MKQEEFLGNLFHRLKPVRLLQVAAVGLQESAHRLDRAADEGEG